MSYRYPGPGGSRPHLLDPKERLKLFKDFELPEDLKCPEAPRQPGFDLGSPCGFTTGPLAQVAFEIGAAMRIRAWIADSEEFNLISAYGVGRLVPGVGYRPFPDVSDYVAYREKYFGARGAYLQYAAVSDKELAALEERKRKLILTPEQNARHATKLDGTRLTATEQQQAQSIFYRWVRIACQKKFGSVAEGLTKWYDDYLLLAEAVKDITRLQWALVPRPERVAAEGGKLRFILGTISDHTRGVAVDVDAGSNPDISPASWRFIMDYVAMAFRYDLSRWINDPDGLYRDIKSMSERFRDKVADNARLVEDYQSLLKNEPKAGQMPAIIAVPFMHGMGPSKAAYLLNKIRSEGRDPRPKSDIDKYVRCTGTRFLDTDPVDVVLETALDEAGKPASQKAALRALVGGFFDLEKDVVLGFRKLQFTWGVTFPSPDLMHFTLDGKTPPPAKGDFNLPRTATA